MLCNKCGKNNPKNNVICKYCRAEMPALSGSNGFGDILSYKGEEVEKFQTTERIGDEDMQKLFSKTDAIIRTTKTGANVSIIALVVSIGVLISSIVFGCVTLSAVNGYKKSTEQKLQENIEMIDDCIEHIKNIENPSLENDQTNSENEKNHENHNNQNIDSLNNKENENENNKPNKTTEKNQENINLNGGN